MRTPTPLLIALAFLALCSGCAHANHPSPRPRVPASPRHVSPSAANASVIATLEKDLTRANVLGLIGLAVSIGLLTTPASALAHWLIPIFGSLTGLSLAGALGLPWVALAIRIALWAACAALAAVLAWTVYLLVKTRSAKTTLTDLEAEAHAALADFGWQSSTGFQPVSASTPAPAVSVTSSEHPPAQPVPPIAH